MDRVRASVRLLRQVYAEGQELRQRLAGLTARGAKVAAVAKEAKRRGLNQDYLWKAQAFANPDTGLNEAELTKLCKWIVLYRRVVGRPFVSRILSAPKGERMKVAERFLREGWTLTDLEAELTRRYGHRRQGGRRPKILRDMQTVLSGLDRRCLSWSRFCGFLHQPPGEDPQQQHVHIEDLPDDLRRDIVAVDGAIRRLAPTVVKHLSAVQPKRKAAKPRG